MCEARIVSPREDLAAHYLSCLARQIGAGQAVLASADGLLIAGVGAPSDDLEELAVYAPSQLPASVERPPHLARRRLELGGERVYLATVGAAAPEDAAEDLARLLG